MDFPFLLTVKAPTNLRPYAPLVTDRGSHAMQKCDFDILLSVHRIKTIRKVCKGCTMIPSR